MHSAPHTEVVCMAPTERKSNYIQKGKYISENKF